MLRAPATTFTQAARRFSRSCRAIRSASAVLEQVLRTIILSVIGDFLPIFVEIMTKEDYKQDCW
jgi:hypothetical protein